MNDHWHQMLRSIEKRRDRGARFFRPTCLLAVIDGIGDGSLSASDIDPDTVVARFANYLGELLPTRADSGWRPFWHLSRDGAWIFTQAGRIVGPDDFRTQRKPNSRRELMSRIDHVFVPSEARSYWRDTSARAELRAAIIVMLEADDADCRLVAAHLKMSSTLDYGARSGATDASIAPLAPKKSGQGFRGSKEIRRAVEDRAMTIAAEQLARDRWQVENVSAQRSYDLHCSRGDETLFVEVKGTAGVGDQIILTANEVTFAQQNRAKMLLIIVSGISLAIDSNGTIVASGGNARSIGNWAPSNTSLRPISYFCAIDAVENGDR